MSAYTIKRVSSAPKAEPLRSVERKHISRAKHPEQNKEQKRRQRENNPRPFVGVDGEGGTTGPCMDELCHAFRACRAYTEVTPATETVPATCSCEHPVSEHRHEYWLLRAGENVLETGQPLTTAKCLAFLADLDPGPLYVGYFFGYDVWQIVADLPPAKLARLNDRKSRTPKSGGREPWPVDVTFGPCGLCECAEWWFDRTEYVVKRSLPKNIDGDAAAIWDALSATKSLPLDPLSDEQVWDHLNDAHRKPLSDGASKGTGRLVAVCECGHASSSHRDNFLIDYLPGNFFKVRRADAGYKWIEVSETGSFFQQSFLKTLNDWEIGTVSEREQIRAGKERRQGFGKPDDEERFYNALEVRLMSELMELLRQTLKECGLPMPRKWQGPGKIAEALLKQHGIPKKEELPFWNDETFKRDMNATYYGGWFELTAVGDVATYELYGFDIGSAYPYALTKVPCLEHGTWTKSDRPTSDLYIAFGVFEAIEDALVYGFSFRSKTGAISHPKNGSGWYWSFEIEASIHQRFTIQRCWSYHQQCGCQPFYWIPALYEQRRRIGKGLKGKVIKLALNSLYGKLCQRVGRAAYNNLVWASFITAHCRTQLQTFIHSLPGCREGGRKCADDVWKLATDGIIASTVPMVMPPDPLTPGLAALLRDHGQDRPGSQSGGRRRHGYVSSKELGAWCREDEHREGVFLVQPGLDYGSAVDGDGKRKRPKTRGISLNKARDYEQPFREAFRKFLQTGRFEDGHVPIPMDLCISLRLAMHVHRPNTVGQWESRERRFGFDWQPKRGLETFPPTTELDALRKHKVISVIEYLRTFPPDGDIRETSKPYDKEMASFFDDVMALDDHIDVTEQQPDFIPYLSHPEEDL